jgi:type I restriction enzyme M protein
LLPYTSISTNVLFLTKGEPTKDIWYFEHKLPEGIKAYNKTKPMRLVKNLKEKRRGGINASRVNNLGKFLLLML